MRSGGRRSKRSDSSDSEDEGKRQERRATTNRDIKSPSTSLLTLSLLAVLGARNLISPGLAEMETYGANMTPMDFPMNSAYKPRPQRLRYRDDVSMMKYSMMKNGQEWSPYMMSNEPVVMMPVAVGERSRPTPPHLARSVSPTTSAHSSHQDPSLEDIDLIDVLWRSDIAAEKGHSQYAPSDQYEHDLQLLTEKSIREPLTTSESARYEDLAKGYFEDFFFPVGCKGDFHHHDDMRREAATPTDEELDALLEDVTKEGGQLDQLCPNGLLDTQGPIINNVTLGQGIIFDANNATELSYDISPCATNLGDDLFSNGTMSSPSWQNIGPGDNWQGPCTQKMGTMGPYPFAYNPYSDSYITVYPAGPQDSVFPMFPQNDTSVPVISTGVHFNHSYTSNSHSELYNSSSYYVPNGLGSYHNESSSVCSSSTTSRSPTYLSDAENMPPASRYYGKLAPTPTTYEEDVKEQEEDTDTTTTAPRRRGRQSKDEQLAKMNNLPLTAKEIAEMSLAELQKMLKSENLSDTQKALIKKIRRRGKNKVAARTCRQRRGDRITKNGQESWGSDSQLDLLE